MASYAQDAISTRPQGTSSAIGFSQFDVDTGIGEKVVLNQGLLWRDFHRRLDKITAVGFDGGNI